MHIMTFNANGIRSAERKAFFDWFLEQNVDVLCVQETKAQAHQLSDPTYTPKGYQRFLLDAQKPGYSGVALYTKQPVDNAVVPLSGLWTDEGRLIGISLDHFDVYSLYLPSGTSGEARQAIKYEMMDELNHWMSGLKRPSIIAGDWNIAHKKIDLKNWQGNQKNSGFLPEERAWLDMLFADGTWVDAFRALDQSEGKYTWWTYRGQARAKNVGWRIDYHIVSNALVDCLEKTCIHPNPVFSDHAPLSLWLAKDKLESLPSN